MTDVEIVEVRIGKQRAQAHRAADGTVVVLLERPGVWLKAGTGSWRDGVIVGLPAPLPEGIKAALEEALRGKGP